LNLDFYSHINIDQQTQTEAHKSAGSNVLDPTDFHCHDKNH